MSANDERQGVVQAVLPSGLYRVLLDGGETVVASLSLKARRVTTKVLPGDRVSVEVFPLDPTRARITSRQR